MSQLPKLNRLLSNQTSRLAELRRRNLGAEGFDVETAAAALLNAFFPTAFGQGESAGPAGVGRARSPYAALAEKPAGYDAAAVASAYARFAEGFQSSGLRQSARSDWDLNGLGGLGADGELDTAGRTATLQLRELVAQVGVAAKDLAGLLQPSQVGEFDKFATGQTCRTGRDNPGNLTNDDHVTLAIYDILKQNQDSGINGNGRPGGISWEELAKQLESKYGIKAEVTTVKSKEGDVLKALKFEGGQVFADGAGDGQADLGDYDFKGAVADITARTGLTREGFAAGAAAFKAGQVDLRKLRGELNTFLKEGNELHRKLDDDFRKRWGEPLGQRALSLPPWLLELFEEKKVEPPKPAQVDPRKLYRESLSDIYGLFALGFALSEPAVG